MKRSRRRFPRQGRYSLRFHSVAAWERRIILAKARKMGNTNLALKGFVKWLKRRGEKPKEATAPDRPQMF
jgi:hypothetical protein